METAGIIMQETAGIRMQETAGLIFEDNLKHFHWYH
jgi:hypothetical protein